MCLRSSLDSLMLWEVLSSAPSVPSRPHPHTNPGSRAPPSQRCQTGPRSGPQSPKQAGGEAGDTAICFTDRAHLCSHYTAPNTCPFGVFFLGL